MADLDDMTATATPPTSIEQRVRALLERVHARLEQAATAVRAAHPAVTCEVRSRAVGASSDFQGHDVRLEVTLPDGEDLVLSVTAAYLTTTPRLDACVEWGHGTEVARAQGQPSVPSAQWPIASDATVAELEQDLPRLVDAVSRAIVQGRRRGGG